MNKLTVLLVVLPLLIPAPALASEPYDFVSAFVRTLEMCKIAQERQKIADTSTIASMMQAMIVFRNVIRQVNSVIMPYRDSKNEYVQKSADSLCMIYTSVMQNSEQAVAFFERGLNDPSEYNSQRGTWLRKLSEIGARADEDWRGLATATAMTTYTLVDMERTVGGNLRFLTITQSERDQLRSQLLGSFGNQVRAGFTEGQSSLIDASAILLWGFLAQDWKPADTK